MSHAGSDALLHCIGAELLVLGAFAAALVITATERLRARMVP